MTDIRYETPLRLPAGWIKTAPSQRSYDNQFSRTMTISEALGYLQEELRQLVPQDIVTIYSGYNDLQSERGRKPVSKDTGVSILIRHTDGQAMLACDKWALTEHNLYALSLAVRSLRSFEPWGIASTRSLLELFSLQKGTSIPVTTDAASMPHWMLYLGLGPSATLEDANAIYRRRAKEVASDEHALIELNQAIEQARRHLC
jgi:hypothetical protein